MAVPEPAQPAKGERVPSVVVSHLDVTYRVEAAASTSMSESPEGFFERLLTSGRGLGSMVEVPAVKDVSFVAYHGESIGIIGTNGSGKSTLLKAVAGLIPPTSGQVWMAGSAALLGVNAVLLPKLSGERNIYIGAQALGLSKQEVTERFADIVEFSGIGEAVRRPMSTLSSGQGSRLRFAISTAAAPDVLMVDEALSTGDAAFRARSAQRIAEIRKNASTVFLVSHSNATIRRICDRVLWMDQGVLLMDGPTEMVLTAYEERTGTKKRKPSSPPPPPERDVPGVLRVGAQSASRTLAALSAHRFPEGADGVILSAGGDLDLAISAVPLAARTGWPVLSVNTGLTEVTRRELLRLRPQEILVVGDDETVDDEVLDRARGLCPDAQVRRLELTDDEHPLVIPPPLEEPGATVSVVTTHQQLRALPLALRAHRQSGVFVITPPHELADEVRELITNASPGQVEHLPGNGMLYAEVLADLEELTGQVPTGLEWDSHATAFADVAEEHEDSSPVVWCVPGIKGLEQVAGVAAAAHEGIPVLTVMKRSIPPATRAALERLRPAQIVLVAGPDVISFEVREELGTLVQHGDGSPTPPESDG